MLIEYQDEVINLNNIATFFRNDRMICFKVSVSCYKFYFETKEQTNKAYEKIIESYRWDRRHLKLDE